MRAAFRRVGMSLTEVMVAVAIMAVVSIPVIGIYMQSTTTLGKTDTRREIRFYIQEILAHANRSSLHELFDNFGPSGFGKYGGKMKDRIAEVDPSTSAVLSNPAANPLRFTSDFMQDMKRDGYDARLHFEFYPRKALGIDPPEFDENNPSGGKASPKFGILHMQAGEVTVKILSLEKLKENGGNEDDSVVARWVQPIMCPAIVGRPGLQLKSCPAIAPDVMKEYGPVLKAREAAL